MTAEHIPPFAETAFGELGAVIRKLKTGLFVSRDGLGGTHGIIAIVPHHLL